MDMSGDNGNKELPQEISLDLSLQGKVGIILVGVKVRLPKDGAL